jgi:hypothetical protein
MFMFSVQELERLFSLVPILHDTESYSGRAPCRNYDQ